MTNRASLTSSVLLTTYNGEAFIEEQLVSILHQTKTVDQVLIFDDGSTDQTVDKVRTFIRTNGLINWSITVNPKNLGPALNTLAHLSELTGDVIFLGDQDDVWEPNKVALMARYMLDQPELSMLVSRTVIVNKDGKNVDDRAIKKGLLNQSRIHRGPDKSIQELTFHDFIGYSSIPLHAMCIRGSVLRRIGAAGEFPSLSLSLGADWYIGIWCTVLGDCRLLPDALMRRRVHGGNISLGRLRKTTLLSATQARRLEMLREARRAHLALLTNKKLSMGLSRGQRHQIDQMVSFLKVRIEFAESPSLVCAARLIFRLRQYWQSAGTMRGGARMWIADVMYAFNLNWNIKPHV